MAVRSCERPKSKGGNARYGLYWKSSNVINMSVAMTLCNRPIEQYDGFVTIRTHAMLRNCLKKLALFAARGRSYDLTCDRGANGFNYIIF